MCYLNRVSELSADESVMSVMCITEEECYVNLENSLKPLVEELGFLQFNSVPVDPVLKLNEKQIPYYPIVRNLDLALKNAKKRSRRPSNKTSSVSNFLMAQTCQDSKDKISIISTLTKECFTELKVEGEILQVELTFHHLMQKEYKEVVGISSSIESFIYSLYVLTIGDGSVQVKKYLITDLLKGGMKIIEQYTMFYHNGRGKQFSMAVCDWENCGIDAIAVHCENIVNICTKDGILCTIDKSDHNELFENTIQTIGLVNLTQQLKRNGVRLVHPMHFSNYSVLQLNIAIATKSAYYLDDIDYLKSYSFYLIIATRTENSQEKNNYLVWKKFREEKSIFINEHLTERHCGYHYIKDLVIDKLYYKDQSRLVFGASFEELDLDWVRAKEEELGESLGYRAIRDYRTCCFFGNKKVVCFYLDQYIHSQEEEETED